MTKRINAQDSEITNNMRFALKNACRAYERFEVPVGVVGLLDGKIIAESHNRVIELGDPTAHAEMLVIKEVAKKLGTYNLSEITLYITLEPCPMCEYAISLAKINSIFFGAYDTKRKKGTLFEDERILHKPKVFSGILQEQCNKLMCSFFERVRENGKEKL